MNLIKRNITVVVLLTAIVVTLSVSFSAFKMDDGPNLNSVTILFKEFEEFEHQAMTAYLKTYSDTIPHRTFVSAGCYECPDSVVGWESRYDDYCRVGTNDVRVIKRYPYSCWQHYSNNSHVVSFYDVVFN